MSKLIPLETKLKIKDAIERKVSAGAIARIHGVTYAYVKGVCRKLARTKQ